MAVELKFRSRNNPERKYKPLDPSFPNDVKEAIAKQLRATSAIYVKDKGVKLAAAIEKRANRKLKEVARFIAQNVVGFPSAPNPEGGAFTEVVVDDHFGLDWVALSRKWVFKKKHGKHFIHKGDLKRAIASKGDAILTATGGIRATVVSKRQVGIGAVGNAKTERVAEILVTYAPAARSPGILPGLINGNPLGSENPALSFEKRLGFSPDIMEKLKGPGDGFIHRPLIQPVVSYWLLYRVPQEITKVMATFSKQNRGGKVYSGTSSGDANGAV